MPYQLNDSKIRKIAKYYEEYKANSSLNHEKIGRFCEVSPITVKYYFMAFDNHGIESVVNRKISPHDHFVNLNKNKTLKYALRAKELEEKSKRTLNASFRSYLNMIEKEDLFEKRATYGGTIIKIILDEKLNTEKITAAREMEVTASSLTRYCGGERVPRNNKTKKLFRFLELPEHITTLDDIFEMMPDLTTSKNVELDLRIYLKEQRII
ncbi:MAG: hypothetical protein AABW88_03835 [Nanoarchaeota archaeon]